MPNNCTVLTNITMLQCQPTPPFTPQWLPNHHLAWIGKELVHVGAEAPSHLLLQRDDVTVIDGQGQCVTPGLMDIHINGAFGCNFAHTTPNQLYHALGQFPQRGITSLVPTVITAPQEDMMASLQTLEEVARQPVSSTATILGFHLEGPFLNPAYKGIHPAEAMPTLRPNPNHMLDVLRAICSPSVRLMTLAPESLPMEAVFEALRNCHIIPLAGHTAATAEDMANGIALGLAGVTHLFNAMKPLHHRAPGTVAMALTHPALMSTIIADGVHVYPEALRVACQACGPDRLALVSDALQLAGTPEGTQGEFAGQTIFHKGGKAANADGTLAGGAALLDDCVRNLIQWGLTDSATAFCMATASPAKLLGESHKRGHLRPGHTADLVLWNDYWQPVMTWINGETAYQSSHTSHAMLAG